ncbi:hypothetical protein EV191_101359 [Tamaricihabitans halophyticus]|uniref:Uncharacterized protein n=1 Tax=Tamaricihabitans halophyticus TaxID=1262583 RepID=A0A4V2SUZ0_9PSEU|nr:hypothetical protein [Tamaricihabitans halophyticus]TCP56416.1 hypothetical protein EV191_101359 [Tamaricihabitans halophyticus]
MASVGERDADELSGTTNLIDYLIELTTRAADHRATEAYRRIRTGVDAAPERVSASLLALTAGEDREASAPLLCRSVGSAVDAVANLPVANGRTLVTAAAGVDERTLWARLRETRDDFTIRRDRLRAENVRLATELREIRDLATAHSGQSAQQGELAAELAQLSAEKLGTLADLWPRVSKALDICGLARDEGITRQRPWVQRAVRDRFAGTNTEQWGRLLETRSEPERLLDLLRNPADERVVEFDRPLTVRHIGIARRWLRDGSALLTYLRAGGSCRRWMPSRPQKDARQLLDAVLVDGQPADAADTLNAVLRRIETEIEAMRLAKVWSEAGVAVSTADAAVVLVELADNARLLDWVTYLGQLRDWVAGALGESGIDIPMTTVDSFVRVLRAVPAAGRLRERERRHAETADRAKRLRAELAANETSLRDVLGRLAVLEARDRSTVRCVPLAELAELAGSGEPAFDVLIIDDAADIGIEHLYLLWLAPTVIAVAPKVTTVGDAQPPPSVPVPRTSAKPTLADDHLAGIEPRIRAVLRSGGSIAELFAARTPPTRQVSTADKLAKVSG